MKTTYANKHLGYLADVLFGPRGTFVELRFRHITGNYKLWHNDVGVGTSVCSSISVIVFSASHPPIVGPVSQACVPCSDVADCSPQPQLIGPIHVKKYIVH